MGRKLSKMCKNYKNSLLMRASKSEKVGNFVKFIILAKNVENVVQIMSVFVRCDVFIIFVILLVFCF